MKNAWINKALKEEINENRDYGGIVVLCAIICLFWLIIEAPKNRVHLFTSIIKIMWHCSNINDDLDWFSLTRNDSFVMIFPYNEETSVYASLLRKKHLCIRSEVRWNKLVVTFLLCMCDELDLIKLFVLFHVCSLFLIIQNQMFIMYNTPGPLMTL